MEKTIKVKVGKKKYRVRFFYFGMLTRCYIEQQSRSAYVSSWARCCPEDKYSIEFGERLARVLDVGGFSKEDRKLFWDAYLGTQREQK